MSWPFCTSGPVPPDSPVYVQREADHQLRQHLLAMDCVLLVAPYQMGKTSLIHRLQAQLAGSSYTIAYADAQKLGNGDKAEWYRSLSFGIIDWFQTAGSAFSNFDMADRSEPLARRFVTSLVRRSLNCLHCRILNSHLSSQLDIKLHGDGQGFRKLLQALAKQAENASKRVVIALDGLNSIPEDFLQTLQCFLIARRAEPCLRNLTLILAGDSAAPGLPAQGTSLMTPLTLKDFYRPQVRQLVDFLEVRSRGRASLSPTAEAITDRIYQWTGGQPYLTQLMCSLLADRFKLRHTRLVQDAESALGNYRRCRSIKRTIQDVDQAAEKVWKEDTGHLPRILEKLKAAPGPAGQLKKIMAGERIPFQPTSKLALIGVVKSNEYNKCTVRNRIYEEAFKRELWLKAI